MSEGLDVVLASVPMLSDPELRLLGARLLARDPGETPWSRRHGGLSRVDAASRLACELGSNHRLLVLLATRDASARGSLPPRVAMGRRRTSAALAEALRALPAHEAPGAGGPRRVVRVCLATCPGLDDLAARTGIVGRRILAWDPRGPMPRSLRHRWLDHGERFVLHCSLAGPDWGFRGWRPCSLDARVLGVAGVVSRTRRTVDVSVPEGLGDDEVVALLAGGTLGPLSSLARGGDVWRRCEAAGIHPGYLDRHSRPDLGPFRSVPPARPCHDIVAIALTDPPSTEAPPPVAPPPGVAFAPLPFPDRRAPPRSAAGRPRWVEALRAGLGALLPARPAPGPAGGAPPQRRPTSAGAAASQPR